MCYWPAGKVLGGSSGINGLIYIRGNVQGYDQMAKRTNDSIWKTENIMKFYKKVENYKGWFSKGNLKKRFLKKFASRNLGLYYII